MLNGTNPARGYWTKAEASEHITLKELKAVTRAVHLYPYGACPRPPALRPSGSRVTEGLKEVRLRPKG